MDNKQRVSSTAGADWRFVDANMGKMSDRQIALKVSVSVNTIRRYRERAGVSPFRVDSATLPERYVQLLGTMPDQQIADLASIPVKTVSAARKTRNIGKAYSSRHDSLHSTPAPDASFKWTSKHRELLGKYSDQSIGKLLGLSKTPVRQERERLGIKPFKQGATVRWTKQRIGRLGQISDPELARELGISVTQVRNKRISMGIAAHGQ